MGGWASCREPGPWSRTWAGAPRHQQRKEDRGAHSVQVPGQSPEASGEGTCPPSLLGPAAPSRAGRAELAHPPTVWPFAFERWTISETRRAHTVPVSAQQNGKASSPAAAPGRGLTCALQLPGDGGEVTGAGGRETR